MPFTFTLTPRDPWVSKYHNTDFKNNFIEKMTALLRGWEPVSVFPKQRRYEMVHGIDGSITFKLDFLNFYFKADNDFAGKAIVNMMKTEGLFSLYYLSSVEHQVSGNGVSINGSIEKGYGYTRSYFPELDQDPAVNNSFTKQR